MKNKKTVFMSMTGGNRRIFVKLPDNRPLNANMSPVFETSDPEVAEALKNHPSYGKTFRVADDKDFREFEVTINLSYKPPVWKSREFDPNSEEFRDDLYTILREIFSEIEGRFSLNKIMVSERKKKSPLLKKLKKDGSDKETS